MTVRVNRRVAAKAATRAKLIAAAERLWERPGSYEAATMRGIAAEAGVSTGAIFANWPGKEDLWREAMGYEPPVDCEAVRRALQVQALHPMANVRRAA